MTGFLEKTNIVSPQELANAILNHAMASSGYQAEDDMTVLVCGLYQKS
jgi:serine phosphatase RsbU (regulator of sigma subunit)